jgi:hypothetical protein
MMHDALIDRISTACADPRRFINGPPDDLDFKKAFALRVRAAK